MPYAVTRKTITEKIVKIARTSAESKLKSNILLNDEVNTLICSLHRHFLLSSLKGSTLKEVKFPKLLNAYKVPDSGIKHVKGFIASFRYAIL